jgi:hypothetical protein
MTSVIHHKFGMTPVPESGIKPNFEPIQSSSHLLKLYISQRSILILSSYLLSILSYANISRVSKTIILIEIFLLHSATSEII